MTTQQPPGGTIVVGVDGSDPGREALHWAAREARLRGAKLVAVHAWSPAPALPDDSLDPVPTAAPELAPVLERDAKDFVEHELEPLRREGIDVESRIVAGEPTDALTDAATAADLLVLGTRGHGRLSGLLLGSVSQKLARHAPCPLVLVPHE